MKLGVGVYEYILNCTSTQNYTTQSLTRYLTITQATPTLSLYLNETEGDISLPHNSTGNITVSIDIFDSIVEVELYSNYSGAMELFENGTAPLYNLTIFDDHGYNGVISFKGIFWGNENYTAQNTSIYSTSLTNTQPSTPSGLTNLGNREVGHPSVSWDPSTDSESDPITYYVYIEDVVAGTTDIDVITSSTSCELGYNVSLQSGRTYNYIVAAWDGYQWSSGNGTDLFVMNSPPTDPSNLLDLGLHEINHNPQINWTRSTDPESDSITYYVYVNDTLDWITSNNYTTIGDNISLEDGYTYEYKVAAWDGYEFSNNVTDIFRLNTPPPNVSTQNDLSLHEIQDPDKIWTGVTDAEVDTVTYIIYVNDSYDGNTTSTSYTLTGLNDGESYNVLIGVWDGFEFGNNSSSDIFRMNTEPSGFSQNTPINYANISDNTPTLVANAASADPEGDSFTYYFGINNSSGYSQIYANSTGLTLTIPSNLADGIYSWNLTAGDGYENGTWTLFRTFRIDTTVPSISSAQLNLTSPVELNSYVDISAVISDPTLDQAWVRIGEPSGDYNNLSMLSTASENGYYQEYQLSSLGTYNFTVFANDSLTHINNLDTTPNNLDILQKLHIDEYNSSVPYNEKIHIHIINTLGSPISDADVHFYDLNNSKHYVNSTGSNGWYTFVGNETGNWEINVTRSGYINSSTVIVNVGDNEPPIFFNNQSSIVSEYTPDALSNFTVVWNDSTGDLSYYYIENNFTGTLQNSTMDVSISDDTYYCSYNLTLGAGNYQFKFLAGDSVDAWNFTDVVTFYIGKADPSISLLINSSIGNKNLPHNSTANLTVNTSIDDAVVEVELYSNYSIDPMQKYANDTAPLYNLTVLDDHGYIGVVSWMGVFWGNQNYTAQNTSIYYFTLTNTPPNDATGLTDLTLNEIDHNPTVSWTNNGDNESDPITFYIYVNDTLEWVQTGNSCDLGYNLSLINGSIYEYKIAAYDGYEWSNNVSDIFRMNTPPSGISQNNPVDNYNTTDTTPDLVAAVATDDENDLLRYYFGFNNSTDSWISANTSALTLTVPITLSDGIYSWNLTVGDGYENGTWTQFRTFRIDTTEPSISSAQLNLTSPAERTNYVNISAKVTDPLLDQVWVRVGSPSEYTNLSMSLIGISDSYSIEYQLNQNGTYNFTIFANDSLGNLNLSVVSDAFSVQRKLYIGQYNSSLDYNDIIYVNINDTLNNLVENAQVHFYDNSSNHYINTTTSTGWCTFKGNLSGEWTINVTKSGYISSDSKKVSVGVNVNPAFSNNDSNIVSIYDPNTLSNFTVTWTDGNDIIDTVFIENNFTGTLINSTMNGGPLNYYYNLILGAGAYQFRFLANDTNDAWNSTSIVLFNISKATPTINVYIDGSSDNKTIGLNVPVNITATLSISETFYLYDNNTLINSGVNPLVNITQYPFESTHNITAYYGGNSNYTNANLTFWIVVNDTLSPQFSNIVNSSSIYGPNKSYQFNITWLDDSLIDTVLFEWNNTNITAKKDGNMYSVDIIDLGVASYNYTWYANDTAGKRNSTSELTFTVYKASPIINLYLNGNDSNLSIEQYSLVNITATLSISETINLLKNSTVIDSGVQVVINSSQWNLPGVFNITAYYIGNENYTSVDITYYLTITEFIGKRIEAGSNTIEFDAENIVISLDSTSIGRIELSLVTSSPLSGDAPGGIIYLNITTDIAEPDLSNIQITWTYLSTQVADVNVENIVFYVWNDALQAWEEIDTQVDSENREVTATLLHLSIFSVGTKEDEEEETIVDQIMNLLTDPFILIILVILIASIFGVVKARGGKKEEPGVFEEERPSREEERLAKEKAAEGAVGLVDMYRERPKRPKRKPKKEKREVVIKTTDELPSVIDKHGRIASLVHRIWDDIDGRKTIHEIAEDLNLDDTTIAKVEAFMEKEGLTEKQMKGVEHKEFGKSFEASKEVLIKTKDKLPPIIDQKGKIAATIHKIWDDIDGTKSIRDIADDLDLEEETVAKIETFLEKNELIEKSKIGKIKKRKRPKRTKKIIKKSALRLPQSIYKKPGIAKLLEEVWRTINGRRSKKEIIDSLPYKEQTVLKGIDFLFKNSLIEEDEIEL